MKYVFIDICINCFYYENNEILLPISRQFLIMYIYHYCGDQERKIVFHKFSHNIPINLENLNPVKSPWTEAIYFFVYIVFHNIKLMVSLSHVINTLFSYTPPTPYINNWKKSICFVSSISMWECVKIPVCRYRCDIEPSQHISRCMHKFWFML